MKYFSMFSGIGGFEYGINKAFRAAIERQADEIYNQSYNKMHKQRRTASCVGFSEIDKYAISVYKKHYPSHTNYGDATKIDAAGLPDFDLLVGGFPCQAFSVAGKRKGFNDTRGTLFFEIARILAEKKTRHLVLENVKGLLNHDSGQTFQTILGVLSDLGYRTEWQVLNSKHFGVPQNRERVFIVGHLRGECGRKVFPVRGADTKNIRQFVDLTIKNDSRLTRQSRALQSRYYKGYSKQKNEASGVLQEITKNVSNAHMVYNSENLAKTLTSLGGGLGAKTGMYAIPVLTPGRTKKRQSGRRFKNNGDSAFTLTGQDRHGVYDGYRIRRLTPLECERLQKFPDNWTKWTCDGKEVSDSQRYKMCGNAVTTSVITAIFQKFCK